MMLALARARLLIVDILIVDEPTDNFDVVDVA
jgi:ATPase subunit of ABC transporter with duplicated ATPase domains